MQQVAMLMKSVIKVRHSNYCIFVKKCTYSLIFHSVVFLALNSAPVPEKSKDKGMLVISRKFRSKAHKPVISTNGNDSVCTVLCCYSYSGYIFSKILHVDSPTNQHNL